MIDGGVSCGQYMRSIRTNLPSGAGSQLASISLPGESRWMRMSSEPSLLNFGSVRILAEYRLIGFFTKKYSALYIVTDQKPLTGGVWPLGKCMTYLFAPE